jgi:DHA2 family multidrug resistance protein
MIDNLTANFDAHGMDGSMIAIKKIAGMVHQQASLLSFMDVFMILTTLFASLVLMTTLLRRPKAAPSGGGGGH